MRILLVEDDPAILQLLATVFDRVGIDYDAAADGGMALKKLKKHEYSALLLDLMLPVVNGFEVVRELRSFAPAMLERTIVVTAASEATLRDFDRSQVFELVRKPFDLDQLLNSLARCTQSGHNAPPSVSPKTYSLRIYP